LAEFSRECLVIGQGRPSPRTGAIGGGYGAIRLTDDVNQNRDEAVWALEKLAEHARAGDYDDLLTLTPEEHDIVRGRPLASD
jgi:hypothetical protein